VLIISWPRYLDAAHPDLSTTLTEQGYQFHRDTLDSTVRYRIPISIGLDADESGQRVIRLVKYNRPLPVGDPNAGRLQGGYIRLRVKINEPPISGRDLAVVWRGINLRAGNASSHLAEEYPSAGAMPFDLPLSRDDVDLLWTDFESVVSPPLVVKCFMVYAGEWVIPADQCGDFQVDRSLVAAVVRSLELESHHFQMDRVDEFVMRCLERSAIRPMPRQTSSGWRQAIFALVRREMLRYSFETSGQREDCRVRLEEATPSGTMIVRVTDRSYGERLIALAADFREPGAGVPRKRVTIDFPFDGTPRQQTFAFEIGTDLPSLGVDRVVVEVTYQEPQELPQMSLLLLTPAHLEANWCLQTRAPARATAEYRCSAFFHGESTPLKSKVLKLDNGNFAFSVPLHYVSLNNLLNQMMRKRRPP
jgi:hypothetical protein